MNHTITIYNKKGKTYTEVPVGLTLLEIYQKLGAELANAPQGVLVNNRLQSLTSRLWQSADVEFFDITSVHGFRVYVRSLCFILSKAANELYPELKLNLEHPVSNGYFCALATGEAVAPEMITHIKKRMIEIIKEDHAFKEVHARTPDAVAVFKEQGMFDKALLLETAGISYTTYFELDGYNNYFYGYLSPSTGYVPLFDLEPYFHGMLLRVPDSDNPQELKPFIKQDKMFCAYKEHLTLLRTMDMNDVGDLNLAIRGGRSQDAIMVSEAMQEKQIAKIAEDIAKKFKEGVRIVMISGPSSSGKTTFSKRLRVQLATNFLHTMVISLDDYYVNREDSPLDENGEYDFESLYAIDLKYLDSDLKHLIGGGEIDLPTYDFNTGKRIYRGEKIKMRDNSVLIMEGIHGLNPELTADIPDEAIYRIYVSALTSISLDGYNWIPTTDNRLIRRMVRDYQFRGYSAKDTLSRWPSVRRGEDKWVFPFQENADAMFNSAMIYEMAALRKYAEPILMEVLPTDDESTEAYRLLKFLQYFNYLSLEGLPGTSLLREFLGGGHFEY